MNYNRLVYNYDLPHRAVTVYMYLRDRVNKDGTCFPSTRTIAADLKISVRTVNRALNDLEKSHLIIREKRWRKNGGKSSSLYTLAN